MRKLGVDSTSNDDERDDGLLLPACMREGTDLLTGNPEPPAPARGFARRGARSKKASVPYEAVKTRSSTHPPRLHAIRPGFACTREGCDCGRTAGAMLISSDLA